MDTKAIEVGLVLQDNRRFTVPIYQRQYAWNDSRLQPFWDDIVAKTEELLVGPPRFQHYMGALILAPGADGYSVGRIPTVQIVDGQQRLTTFQLFLAALRHVATNFGLDEVAADLEIYTFNDARGLKDGTDLGNRLKLVPTPADRDLFKELMTNGLSSVRIKNPECFYKNGNVIVGAAPRALLGFVYFEQKIREYTEFGFRDTDEHQGGLTEEPADARPEEKASVYLSRLQGLANALLLYFKLVVITLEEKDDAQVIFETLNSRGEPLLAMDLVRNNIFHRAELQGNGSHAEDLFERKWKPLDSPFWKEDAPRAKPKRPRIDHFLNHALTALTGQEISMREIYAEYRAFTRPKGKPRFETVEVELDVLLQFKPVYETLEQGHLHDDLSWLGKKLATWEVSTAYPLIFLITTSNIDDIEKSKIYRMIYSYIVRRAICGLTTQNLNKNFTRIVANMLKNRADLETFCASFDSQSGSTVRFPDDREFCRALEVNPIYEWFGKPERLKDILWELERASQTKFQAINTNLPELSIEHVLPQSWTSQWPLPDGRLAPPDKVTGADPNMLTAIRQRDELCHVIGNLTLAPPPLNASMSNDPFDRKRGRLGQSLLALNVEFSSLPSWDETAIRDRGRKLAEKATTVWPYIR
ncbi:hypothetical protein MSC49_22730 [Methylosinus sp. C49]|uniref:DUF262 domain-containing protein n=1 Tax=Methylosinus sp. C49 TaxID=2699395 RepID=UPI0013671E95|nr:DUF262 domain-containing protein [Methylosinus sp. C49]BBU62338.1 hypothetical protein MSC49_22730 [Methylosinus sp. C49]